MRKHNCSLLLVSALVAFGMVCPEAFGTYSGLNGFSPEFIRDYDAAQRRVDQIHSAEPLLALLSIYRSENEQAELELSIGLVYHQRTGALDFPKAVQHLTVALGYDLPERTRLEIFEWRATAHEQLKNFDAALRDFLRELILCSYYDLPGKWPENEQAKEPVFLNSPDPENTQRLRDGNEYTRHVEYVRFLLKYRYEAVNAARRMRSRLEVSDAQTINILERLSPDSTRYGTILRWL